MSAIALPFPASGAALEIELGSEINYALIRGGFPYIQRLTLKNTGSEPLRAIAVSLCCPYMLPIEVKAESLAPASELDLTAQAVARPDVEALLELTEACEATLTVTVALEGQEALRADIEVKATPYDQWMGAQVRPELLAEFVTPNHPLVSRVLSAAAAILKDMTGSDAFDGYLSGSPTAARAQMAAIYQALRQVGISYVVSPPSFERTGQRVRMVPKVLGEKLGNCLDLSLLYASCLEAAGLHPILVLLKGHCMAGAWLARDCSAQPVGDDAAFLLSGAVSGVSDIAVIECTCIAQAQPVGFEQAADIAISELENEDRFECHIDVARARLCGIRPMPLPVKLDDGTWEIDNDAQAREEAPAAVRVMDRYDLSHIDLDNPEVTKFTIWERKLLDFSLRNALLNMRTGRRSIPLLSFAIDRMEDILRQGSAISVRPFPLDTAPQPQEGGFFSSQPLAAELEPFALEELKQKRIFTFLTAEQLADAARMAFRASQTSLEESGANSLFLVLGMLQWRETDSAPAARRAPILLVPIDISRPLGARGVTIRARDEESMINITLVELLRQQHGIDLTPLLQLPADESGADVRRVLATVADKIRGKRGWRVIEEAMIGVFSFSKFVMWADIHTHAAQLQSHPIVRSLVEGKLDEQVAADLDVEAMEAEADPAQFAIPIDVDSSQLEAVIAAAEGKSFVLHGPPGTGKSQTITNIIANALYHGRRVLFVAEKRAALEVVQQRLQSLGLAPFCLELHSNKVTKQHFLGQLDAALSIRRGASAPAYEQMAEKLAAQAKELSAYVAALHRQRPCGASLYECIERYLKSDVADELAMPYTPQEAAELTAQSVEEGRHALLALAPLARRIGPVADHPLRELSIDQHFDTAEATLRSLISALAATLRQWQAKAEEFRSMWGFALEPFMDNAPALKALEALLQSPLRSYEAVETAFTPGLARQLLPIAMLGRQCAEAIKAIGDKYGPQFITLPADMLYAQWQRIQQQWWLPRFFTRRSFIKSLPASATPLTAANVGQMLAEVSQARHDAAEFQDNVPRLKQALGYRGSDTTLVPDALKALESASSFIESRKHALLPHLKAIARALPEVSPAQAAPLLQELSKLEWELAQGLEKLKEYCTLLPPALAEMLPAWEKSLEKLRDWVIWRKASRQAAAMTMREPDLSAGAEAYAQALVRDAYRAMAQVIIDADPGLSLFASEVFDQTIETYRRLSAEFQQMSRQALYCNVASRMPSITMEAHESSEMGILRRAIRSGGRGRSIRSIIDSIPTLLPKLCPVMLMSPLSVAQYLKLEGEKADVVIFDEASQMPTSEAVGAIARGSSVIVVGDPMQMPPTSFFNAQAVADDEAHIDDMESILDDCLALSVPSLHLSWHYRSRHESLIAFSNQMYYAGRLTTFPSADNLHSRVSLRHVEGTYDRSGSRSNRAEAEAVAAEVIARLELPEGERMSVGVVAFSKAQQDLIDDILSSLLAQRPDLEDIAYNSPEPVFVKNLENVQGDERDVILFSVGYGPDRRGKVSMNFGPLNMAGGERRLNVAVSRSRREMVVFSSLSPDDIDLRRTGAKGAEGLKRFLEYAASGGTASSYNNVSQPDSVEQTVCRLVRSLGYEADEMVGASEFKVDVAVRDPRAPGRYLLAILCDGPRYHRAKTSRDRERVQPAVLRSLGWHVLRVWTPELMRSAEDTLERIRQAIEAALAEGDPQTEPATAPAPVNASEPDSEPMSELASQPSEAAAAPKLPAPYPTALYQQVAQALTSDGLYAMFAQLREFLAVVVAKEQPITASLLHKRAAKAFGLSRVTAKTERIVDQALGHCPLHAQTVDDVVTYWTTPEAAAQYTAFRDSGGRDISEYPPAEIDNAMLFILSQQVGLDPDTLMLLTAQALGYTRRGPNIEAAMRASLQRLLALGRLRLDANKVTEG